MQKSKKSWASRILGLLGIKQENESNKEISTTQKTSDTSRKSREKRPYKNRTNRKTNADVPASAGEKKRRPKAKSHIEKTGEIKPTQPASDNKWQGIIMFTRSGSAYVTIEGQSKDMYIPAGRALKALPGDLVKVKCSSADGRRGQVIKVLERADTNWVCTLVLTERSAFAKAGDARMPYDIYISGREVQDAENGDKVIVKITHFEPKDKSPAGQIVKVLGKAGENDTEMHAILEQFGLPYDFPEAVEKEASCFAEGVAQKELEKRRDFRKTLTLTIDPIDAKDFDDALSIEKLENGNWEIGVHIADVSHYVKPGTELDKEAYKRGNSVYLSDRVVPMLPERLSNELCSLRPNEEKYCFSAIFELDETGKVHKHWYGKGVMYSQQRFTYEEAQDIIEGKDTSHKLVPFVLQLHNIASAMRKKRLSEGALEVSSKEVRFQLDETGFPVSVYQKIGKEANFLVEEFMLLANKYVARVLGGAENKNVNLPLVYRVHDNPDMQRLQELQRFVKKLGFELTLREETLRKELNDLLHKTKNTPHEHVISQMVVRSMAKAVYSTDNIGHYGLNFPHYAHFTSPIRRYADLLVHRALEKYLDKQNPLNKESLEAMAKHISATERKAVEAERESAKYMQVKFLESHIGEEFYGVVTGITEWGIYVELEELFCEGMISLRGLQAENFQLNEKELCLESMLGEKITYGDRLKVRVISVDTQRRTIDFKRIA
jgi:ribonuclease R